MYTLLNKKKYGFTSYLMGFVMTIMLPFMFAIKMVDDNGGGGNPELDKAVDVLELRVKKLIESSEGESEIKRKAIEKEVASINKAIEKLTSEQIDTLKARVDELAKQNEALTAASKTQGLEMAKLQAGNSTDVPKDSFIETAKAAIMKYKETFLEEITDTYGTRFSMKKWFDSGKGQSPVFELKNAANIISKVSIGDMTTSAIAQSNVSALRLTELAAGTYGLPLAIYPHVLDYFPQRMIGKPNLSMFVTYSYEDGADTKVEGSASTQSSLLFKTVNFPAFAVYTYFTLTDEVLDDLGEALSEINRVAPDKIKSKLDEFVYRTTGDDSSAIKGLFAASKATTFDATDYASTIVGANRIDLIECMIADCEGSDYVPDTVGLNPKDIRLYFNSLKNDLNDSIRDNRLVFANGKLVSISGLRVVASTKITQDTCFVGAINQLALLGIRKDMTLEIGLNSTDFVEGQKTARVGMRVALGCGDPLGIIYCATMADDTDEITKTVTA